MPTCALCGSEASLRCGACSEYQTDIRHYCSKGCQVLGWKSHKNECKLGQLYGRMQDLFASSDYAQINTDNLLAAQKEVRGLTEKGILTMRLYFVMVPPDSRPLKFSLDARILKDEVIQAIDRVKQTTRKKYKADYKTRVSKELREKSDNPDTRHEVPFDFRPYNTDASPTNPHGGIEFYPSDYAQLGFMTFLKTYGSGRRVRSDPFACHHTAAQCMTEHMLGG